MGEFAGRTPVVFASWASAGWRGELRFRMRSMEAVRGQCM
jgi:hypothetical protein